MPSTIDTSSVPAIPFEKVWITPISIAGRVWISWYTQHAYIDGTIARPYRMDSEALYSKGTVLSLADVYFAELELE